MSLTDLESDARVWRGGEVSPGIQRTLSSGYAELDEILSGGGWPVGALTELLTEHQGIGAMRLLMPALARLSREDRWLAWIAPPYLPYPPALVSRGVELSRVLLVHHRSRADDLWALEQALRSGTCGAVLGWMDVVDPRWLRRLQLGAETGDAMNVLFRTARASRQASPAALRLQLSPGDGPDRLTVRVLKMRGGWPGASAQLSLL